MKINFMNTSIYFKEEAVVIIIHTISPKIGEIKRMKESKNDKHWWKGI